MPNLAKLLKDEIQRIARRELKPSLTTLRKDSAALKRTAADLKRRLAKVESGNKRLLAQFATDRQGVALEANDEVKSARITAKMIRKTRDRLGLSQEAFARLVGVSSQAVYQWERKLGRLALRGDRKAMIVSVRKLGKREAKERLAEL